MHGGLQPIRTKNTMHCLKRKSIQNSTLKKSTRLQKVICDKARNDWIDMYINIHFVITLSHKQTDYLVYMPDMTGCFCSQDTDLLSPGIVINSISPSLEGSRHLSRSNIDIPRCLGPDDPKTQLPRKRSDLSTYELDTIKHHQAFLSR